MVSTKIKNYSLILLLILAIGSFFRLWQLETIPPGLWSDEAINANQAISSPGEIFYPENQGREGLFMNLIHLSFSVLGISIFSFRIVPAILGILTILGLYLLAKELFKNEHIALLSSFFLATSFWHINFSRIGFRAILVPFILVFVFYFLFLGFRKKSFWPFLASGIFFGLGFYTYIAFRVAVIILIFVLIFWWFIYKKQGSQKKYFQFTIPCLFLIFLIALPICFYFLQNPSDFISRAEGVSVFAQDSNFPLSQFKAFFISAGKHLAMFNIYGDPNWRHNFSGAPELFWPIGILFLIGLFLSIKKIFTKKSPALSYWTLVVWFLVMLLPGVLSYEGLPHSLRVIGVIPVVYIFAGIGGVFIFEKIKKFLKSPKLFYLVLIIFLVFITFSQFHKYFISWGQNEKVKEAFSQDLVEMGNYLKDTPLEIKKYVIIYGGDMPVETIKFILETSKEKHEVNYILPTEISSIKIEKETIILPMEKDEELLYELWQKFPQGEIQSKNRFWVYKINY